MQLKLVWNIKECATFSEVAEAIHGRGRMLCTGYKVGNVLVVNLAYPGSIPNYAVISANPTSLENPEPLTVTIDDEWYLPEMDVTGWKVEGRYIDWVRTNLGSPEDLAALIERTAKLSTGSPVTFPVHYVGQDTHKCPYCR